MRAMPRIVERLYQRGAYIGASLVLLAAAALVLPCAVVAVGGPVWLGFLLGIALLILLTIVTYGRLRNAALSGSWVVLMLIVFEVGPSWVGPPPLVLHLSDLVYLIPVIMGWAAPGRAATQEAALM